VSRLALTIHTLSLTGELSFLLRIQTTPYLSVCMFGSSNSDSNSKANDNSQKLALETAVVGHLDIT
jgi:hypothetical protein